MSPRDEERDELFNLWLEHGTSFESDSSEGKELAEAILAAGYRRPRTITTAEELDVLPMGSVVLDAQGWVAVILPTVDGQRCLRVAKAGDNLWALNSLVAQRMLPATVLHEGGAA